MVFYDSNRKGTSTDPTSNHTLHIHQLFKHSSALYTTRKYIGQVFFLGGLFCFKAETFVEKSDILDCIKMLNF